MGIGPGGDQFEPVTERFAEARRVISHDRQAATALRPIQRKCCDDGVSSNFHSSDETRDIGRTVRFTVKEVERRPVVPDVIGVLRLPDRHIGNKPLDLRGPRHQDALSQLPAPLRTNRAP